VTEREKLYFVKRIGDMMDSTNELDLNKEEPGSGNTINVNSADNRVAARDYIEINIHLSDQEAAGLGSGEESPGLTHQELIRQIRSLVSRAVRSVPQEAA